MTKFLALILFTTAVLSLVGCDKAKTFVKETKEGYREVEEIAEKVSQIASAVKTNDFAQAKEYARKLEPFLNTRVLTWAVQVLAIEEKEGAEAARQAIARFGTTKDITPSERAALGKMQDYYQGRSGRTGDLVVFVGAIIVDEKFGGHGAGGLFMQICETFRTAVTNGGAVTTSTNRP